MSNYKKYLPLASPIYWPAWLAFAILWSIIHLPIRWQLHIGSGLGKLLHLFPGKLKNTTWTNIQLCFPELTLSQQQALMKKNFISLGIGLIEAARAWWLPNKKLQHTFTITGYEHVEQAYQQGKGIILISAHCTSLEMMARLLGMKYSFAAMYRPHKKKLIAFIHETFRKRNIARHIPRHKMREVLRTLQDNMAVWYAYDVDGGKKHSVFAPFFNIQTASLTSVSRLAKLSHATVIPIRFARHDNQLTYEIVLSPPLENFPSDDLIQDATRLNAIIEHAVREKPEQYVWQYKRFKTRPEGEKKFY